jgi:hypothetical protein
MSDTPTDTAPAAQWMAAQRGMPSPERARTRPSEPTDHDAGPPPIAADDLPHWRVQRTEHIGQLTGRKPNPIGQLGMLGTDLGVSFHWRDSLLFVFGDTGTINPFEANLDSLARVEAQPRPVSVPKLSWLTRTGGGFLPLRVAGADLGFMNVPIEGVTLDDTAYLFFASGWSDAEQRHSSSVLAHATAGDFASLRLDHAVVSDYFINVSAVVNGDDVWIWGSGVYRKSAIYLAHAPRGRLADRSSWTYYRAGAWVDAERDARPLFDTPCVGELSARRHEPLGLYMLAYDCFNEARSVLLSVARSPAGPWSEPVRIFEPEQGYEHFMHAANGDVGHDDGLSEDGRQNEAGGEYGPYLIPDWFVEPAPGVHEIVYTLSSWNPYQVQLLRSVLVEPSTTYRAPTPGAGLPRAQLNNPSFGNGTLTGWTAEGDAFVSVRDDSGRWGVTTYATLGASTKGKLWQEFDLDALSSSLSFTVRGGHAAVVLYADGDVVRRTIAADSDATIVHGLWRLETLRGKRVRLAIEDDATDAWGFIQVSAFELR